MSDPPNSGSRRRYLETIGGVVTGVLTAGCNLLPGGNSQPRNQPDQRPARNASGTPRQQSTPQLTRYKISFDRHADLVADFGADPTGSEPVDDAIADAMRAGTLVEVPAGTYKLTSTVDVSEDRVGFLTTGDARFVLADGFSGRFLQVDGPDEFLFEGIDVDMRGRSSGHMRLHCPSTFHVQDVTYHGRGANAGYAFNVALQNPSGVGRLRNVRVPHGSDPSVYGKGNGRIGLWAGFRHKGTLRFENSELSEFGNNGIYSRCPGNIQVVDSYFSNNNVASVRIAGKGSFVENSTIVIDFSEYDGPFSSPNEAFGPAGVVFDNKKPDLQSAQLPPKGYPGEVRGSRIELRNVPDSVTENRGAAACVDIWGTTRAVRIVDSDLRVDIDGVQAVVREHPQARGAYRADMSNPPGPHWVELDDVRITGTADGREAVFVDGADGTSITNTDIQQSGRYRDGIKLTDSPGTVIDGGGVNCSTYPIVVEQWTPGVSGPCPLLVGNRPTLVSRWLGSLGRSSPIGTAPVGTLSGDGRCRPARRPLADHTAAIAITNISRDRVRMTPVQGLFV